MVKGKQKASPKKKKVLSVAPKSASTPAGNVSNPRNNRSNAEETLNSRHQRRTKIRRGKRALQEIRFYQKTSHFLIPKLSFCRYVREVLQKSQVLNLRIQSVALEALQEASEAFLTRFLEEANLVAIHSRRVTLMPKDMNLLRYLKYCHSESEL